MARRTLILSLAVVVLGALGVGWVATREEIASGSGKKGDWRVVASWDFGSYCLKRYYGSGEGGACEFTEPATINESLSWKLFRGDEAITFVTGPVPPDAMQVRITPKEGQPMMADLTKVLGMTFFSAEVPGVQAVDIEALDDSSKVVQDLQHGPLPPPVT